MPSRRYPRMTERPEDFQVNPEWPLWNDLFCFFAPQSSVMRLYGQVDEALLRYSTNAVVKRPYWIPEIGRFAVDLQNERQINKLYTGKTYSWSNVQPMTAMGWITTTDVFISDSYGTDLISICNNNVGLQFFFESGTLVPRRILLRIIFNCDLFVRTTTTDLVSFTTTHHAITYDGSGSTNGMNTYVNGKPSTKQVVSNSFTSASSVNFQIAISGRQDNPLTITNAGYVADLMLFRRVLSQSEIEQLADPTNVDLRIGNVPLILSPRRRFWPVVTQAAPSAGKVPWHLLVQSV
jgi:hypothetical protein